MNTNKRTIRNPEKWIGKKVDSIKWNIPGGYWLCAKTGKMFAEKDLTITFFHWVFTREFRIQHGLTVEDADWLSEEGYDLLMLKLQELGLEVAYHEAVWNDTTINSIAA